MIHIVGLGGIGFWLTVGLSRFVAHTNLTCWDHDTLNGTGALRLPHAPPTTSKANLLRGFLLVSMGEPYTPVLNERRFFGTDHGIQRGDLIVDCTDMAMRGRRAMWTRSRRKGANLLRVSYDGRSSTIVAASGLPLIAPVAGGYAEMPSLALSLAAGGIGAELVRRYLANPVDRFELALSIGEVIP